METNRARLDLWKFRCDLARVLCFIASPPAPVPHQRYATYSAINQRENNEDSFQIFTLAPTPSHETITILAVADGLGGYERGEEFSRLALEKLSLSLCQQLVVATTVNRHPKDVAISPADLGPALTEALRHANHYIQRLIERNNWKKGGSTLVVAAILGERVAAANLGDSPLLHYRTSEATLVQLTTDHTVANALLEANAISPAMAACHAGRHQLLYYVGCPELPAELPAREADLKSGDLLLLCSDGISGSLSLEAIQKTLQRCDLSLSERAETLARQAIEVGETDNQTLVLWQQ